MLSWFILYLLLSLFYKWIISWGGAKKIEGWKSFFIIGWFAFDWSSEQIRFFALISWIILTFIFIYGLMNSQFRNEILIF